MTERILSRSLRYSLCGHLIFFSIFSFSFGLKILKPRWAGVTFVGALLRSAEVNAPALRNPSQSQFTVAASGTWLLPQAHRMGLELRDISAKPLTQPVFQKDKVVPEDAYASRIFLPKRKDSVVMFHPQLPYHFLLYFIDRQEAHLELEFRISSYEQTSSVTIKRKISSGNLEVDLLSMRYLNHYLSMQLGRFPLNQWQAVKIDFRPKNN